MQTIKSNSVTIVFTILAIGSLPPITYGLFGLYSYMPGLLIANLLVILLTLGHIKNLKTFRPGFYITIIIIIIYFSLQHLLVGPWTQKSYLSLLPCLFILATSYVASFGLNKPKTESLVKAVGLVFYTLLIIAAINMVAGFKIGEFFGYGHTKPLFPFREPSHFALFVGPLFIAYYVITKNVTKRIFSLLAIVALSLVLPSTTLLCYGGIAILITALTNKRKSSLIMWPVLIFIFGLTVNIILSSSYFLDRFEFSQSSTNLTAVVYMQGYADTVNSLVISNGLGLGFQMLGTQPPSQYALIISEILGREGSELNRQDGGFLAAKLLAELGLLGFALIAIYLLYFYKSFKFIVRNISNDRCPGKALIGHCIVISFIVEMLGRSTGYFSPSVFIFLVAVFYISQRKNRLLMPPIKC